MAPKPDTPKPTKKRRQKDPLWKNRKSSGINKGKFDTKSLLQLMNALNSPVKKIKLVSQKNADQENVSPLIFSTPQKNKPEVTHETPGGTKLGSSRLIRTENDVIVILMPVHKINRQEWTIPLLIPNIVKNPIPQVNLDGIKDFKITRQMIRNVPMTRKCSQKDVMKISASEALKLAGIAHEKGDAHWLHFIPHAFMGDASQSPENMGIGTRHANAAMELVNPVLKKMLLENNDLDALYITATPEWVEGYDKIRLMKSITYLVKDGPANNFTHSVSFKFNTLSLAPICESEIEMISKFIQDKFTGNQASQPTKQAKLSF